MEGNAQVVSALLQSARVCTQYDDGPLRSVFAAVLDQLAEPLVLLGRYRDLVFTNRTACRIAKSDGGFSISNGRFSTGCVRADGELDEVLEAMSREPESEPSTAPHRGLRVSRRGKRRDWAIIVRRLTVNAASGCTSAPIFLLQAHSRITIRACVASVLRDCYGATEAESAASALLNAGSTKGASRTLHRSSETVRSHLKSLFRRCDVHSKTELAALLWSSTLFAGPASQGVNPSAGRQSRMRSTHSLAEKSGSPVALPRTSSCVRIEPIHAGVHDVFESHSGD